MKIAAIVSVVALALVGTANAVTKLPAKCLGQAKVICVSKVDSKVRLVEHGRIVLALEARFGDGRGSQYATWEGSTTVYRKEAMSWSAPYRVYMPYSLYFHGGQAIHYSYAFANEGYSSWSHGCINTRDMRKMARLFSLVPIGTPVFIY